MLQDIFLGLGYPQCTQTKAKNGWFVSVHSSTPEGLLQFLGNKEKEMNEFDIKINELKKLFDEQEQQKISKLNEIAKLKEEIKNKREQIKNTRNKVDFLKTKNEKAIALKTGFIIIDCIKQKQSLSIIISQLREILKDKFQEEKIEDEEFKL